jgi:hypothetical protein
MKKTFIAVFFSLFVLSSANADIGLNVGVSAQLGEFETKGKETSSDGTSQTSDAEKALFASGSYFIEKDLAFLPAALGRIGSRVHIGYDNMVHDISLGTQSNFRDVSLGAAGATVAAGDNTLTASITGFETVYATVNITDWLYVKAGTVTVDVATEHFQSGIKQSSYGNSHSLDGDMYGFGISKSTDNGFFMRIEYNNYDIEGKKVVSSKADSKFTAELQDSSGDTTRVSIGKSF